MKTEKHNYVRPLINLDKGPAAIVRQLMVTGESFEKKEIRYICDENEDLDWRVVLWTHLKWEEEDDY